MKLIGYALFYGLIGYLALFCATALLVWACLGSNDAATCADNAMVRITAYPINLVLSSQ